MLVPEELWEELEGWVRKVEEKQPSLTALDPQIVTLWLARIALYARGMLEGGFLVLIFTIFMLFEATNFPSKVKRVFGKDSPINIEHFHRIADDVRRYLVLKTLSNLMSASAAYGVYYMFGVPDAFFWALVAFFMYYIPNIGGTLAAIVPGLLIFLQADISMVLLYAVCLLTVECAIAYGIEPKLLGHGLRLSVLVIILSLFFWGFMLGPIGLFLAAPIMVMIKVILQAFPETRWLAIFLEGGREKH
jgi:predicted PurR-regulated permease PerM